MWHRNYCLVGMDWVIGTFVVVLCCCEMHSSFLHPQDAVSSFTN